MKKWATFVMSLQTKMNALGASLTVDGDPGPKTQAAFEAFDAEAILSKSAVPSTPSPQPGVRPTTGQDSDEGTGPWYRKMWNACVSLASKGSQIAGEMALIEKGMSQYLDVAKRLGAVDPQDFAYILGVIHYKEGSCDFRGCLHNGQKIIGTGKKTTIVPIGRGPFATWSDAAVDAIGIESSRWSKLLKGGQNIEDILYALERYNGTGYITGAGKADVSPYLWENSNVSDGTGKYPADGKYDPNQKLGSTSGAATLLKEFARQGKFKVV